VTELRRDQDGGCGLVLVTLALVWAVIVAVVLFLAGVL
jgi:hypothetical protein